MKVLMKSDISSPVFGVKNKAVRVVWFVVYCLFFRTSPSVLHSFRVFLLRIFGASIGSGCCVYPDVKVWLPSNLKVGDKTAIGPRVNIYNQGFVEIGSEVVISQGSHICASTHDYSLSTHPLILQPITVSDGVWLCADSFVGPGVSVKEGAVLGARGAAFRDLEAWVVYSGNPAVVIKKREIFDG